MSRALDTAKSQQSNSGPVPPLIAGKNFIINGGMDFWQRGTSFTVSNNAYLMDRWYNTGDTNLTVTRDTDVPTDPYFQYSAKLVGTGTQSITQKIESANSQFMAGKVVTISLYAKKTSGTGALNINIYYPSAKDNFASLTQIGSALQLSSNPGSSWAKYSVTVTMPSNIINGLAVLIDNVNSHTIFVTGVQVELGSTATPFSRAGGTIQGELAACQRYYEKSYPTDTALGTVDETYATWTSANAGDTSLVNGTAYFKVTKRIQPTITIYNTSSGTTGSFLATSTSYTVSSVATGTHGIGRVYATTGMTANTYVRFHWTASAEL